ncbi:MULTISPECIES: membrane lipoprotein lipid attachment site-containing protein [Bacillus]|uniref:membrane lipoprotein lipid attachment site-containing protein n=1 Tax=Bacillus TaxID=1386 RepID=UPI00099382A3|nr:membrane lipoprotein lipid attachment site-containing protein [Bacillus cereus]OOQ92741.1 NADH dehydrogenase [Bacillus cereus]
MKRIIFTIITAMFILSGCGGPEYTPENLDGIVSGISKDKEIKNHLKSVTYKETEKSDQNAENPYYYYDIVASLNDSFDSLQPKEQYEYLASIGKIIKKQSGTPQGNDREGELFCGKGVRCELGNVVLKTDKHEYYANYNLPDLTGDWLHLDDKDKSADEKNIIYDASAKDGKYIKPDTINKPASSSPSPSTSTSSSANEEVEKIKSATGRDWVELSFDDKFIYVQTVIESMKSAGRSVTADAYWFIDALNAYYGGGEESNATDKIIDIMAMTGVSGGVIK